MDINIDIDVKDRYRSRYVYPQSMLLKYKNLHSEQKCNKVAASHHFIYFNVSITSKKQATIQETVGISILLLEKILAILCLKIII